MDKISQLKSVVGLVCSCNSSPTLRAKLVNVGTSVCTLEVTATMYNRNQWANTSVGRQFQVPTSIVHNMYFFQAMKIIQITLQERWAASQSKVHKSKKSYNRKDKHKKRGSQNGPLSYFFTHSTLLYLLPTIRR